MVKKEIVSGTKYNCLTIIQEVEPTFSKKNIPQRRVECKCDCGKIKTYYYFNITSGLSQSCGCLRDRNVSNASKKYQESDLVGRVVNSYVILKEVESFKYKTEKNYYSVRRFKCECQSCKKIKVIGISGLVRGTSNCHCLTKKRIYVDNDSNRYSKYYWLYTTWNSMMKRCYNKKATNYKNYGARGISVYSEWVKYLNFKEWILTNLGERPFKTSLDRINNEGNYEPGNLRWATSKEQSENKRKYKIKNSI